MRPASVLITLLMLQPDSVPADPQDITVRPGEDVTLPCQGSSGGVSLLAWNRTEPKTDKYVFHFRDGILSENFQNPSFRGRVELSDPEMKDGDGSIVLKNVTINDSGTYECLIAEENAGRRKIDPNPNPPKLVNTIHLKVEESGPTAGIQDDEGNPGLMASAPVSIVIDAVVTVVAPLLLLVLLLV
ncbi:butyrophilin subfamily 1 member A1-like [Pagrus major]|uniref:butyrophilin subfamily 1 member A1-like n=1 Tax=Pagrus major TaxID=143350 RepID=UPI003CC8D0B8